ncbi:meiotic nuclear division protein 1 [Lineolata rhizophorae]|uniref:Meiotic nuclear division protein 1 n=1 Tax=Lineolata rhizophorae TaxID=578093 RepID=A0A6A6NUJ7_9PEZI|nr:meiotic nuclear division protein 1 [Lineolata rhizophorae]
MAPKSLPPAAKQALIVSYFHASGVAHSIKDLEKALPGVASINAMQVKDYLQALVDDNRIRVEKIGSGNWYWAFAGEETRARRAELGRCEEERERAKGAAEEVRRKVEEARKEREDDGEEQDGDDADDEMLEGSAGAGNKASRSALLRLHEELLRSVGELKKELAAYSENDPVEVDKRRARALETKQLAEKWTEQIQSMESWLREATGGDRDQLLAVKRQYYGDEFSEEEEDLREL